MSDDSDSLLRDGLAFLGKLLPKGYTIGKSAMSKPDAKAEEWIVIRAPDKRCVTCLVIARRRVESRDLGTIAASAARTRNPSLLLSTYLSPIVREKLRGFGLGCWDLTGNVRIGICDIDLSLEQDGASLGSGERSVRSLSGEMGGRVARALIDIQPPYTLGELAECARVEPSYASRVISFLGEIGLLQRKPRSKIEGVDWQELLRRWSLDAPLQDRGESFHFTYAKGLPDFLTRLGQSGFLHALTGELAFAKRADRPLPNLALLYVDDVPAGVEQFSLHAVETNASIILMKAADRSIFLRSSEAAGLRYVSPSLMAADLADSATFEAALAWMVENVSAWRTSMASSEVDQGSRNTKGRR
jgi:hypothetical protein